MIKEILEKRLLEMEKISKLFDIKPFDFYLLGEAALVLSNHTTRVTRDFDFLDLNYKAQLGKVFASLRTFDMLDYKTTILSPSYKSRAVKLEKFSYLNIYTLSAEDIIVSKIIRLENKDIEDIDILIKVANKTLINKIINDVLNRNDLFETKKIAFKRNLSRFKEIYNV